MFHAQTLRGCAQRLCTCASSTLNVDVSTLLFKLVLIVVISVCNVSILSALSSINSVADVILCDCASTTFCNVVILFVLCIYLKNKFIKE